MKKNLILEYKDSTKKTYRHLAHTVDLILRNDFKSNYSLSYRTLERYAIGATVPSIPVITKAIAKMLKVEPAELIKNLNECKRCKDGNNTVK